MGKFIVCGTLFDGVSKTLQTDVAIEVEGSKIVRILPKSAVPAENAEIIDLSDKFVSPGFIDLHAHVVMDGQIDPFNDMLYTSHAASTIDGILRAQRDLLAGFTTIRDCGGSRTGDAIAIRDAINNGKIDGPRMLVSGPYLVTSGVNTLYQDGGLTFDGVDEALKVARQAAVTGVDQIKHLGILHVTTEEMQALGLVARETGKLYSIHATDRLTVWKAANAAPDSIEHCEDCDDRSLELIIKNGICIVPTFCPIYYSKQYAEQCKANGTMSPELADRKIARANRHFEQFPRLVKSGAIIGFGADTGATLIKHGDQAIEMEFMNRYGMAPIDILLSATSVAAKVLRMADKIGAVAPGMLADLVAFDGDPIADIRVTQDCKFVMKNGVVYKGAGARQLAPALA